MSQWAEVRQLHLVEGVPKKEIARRLRLDVKTVRRAIRRSTPPVRVSAPRPSALAPWRERIRQWLREEPRVTAKRIRRLLLPLAGPVPARTVRRYVAEQRAAARERERDRREGSTAEVRVGDPETPRCSDRASGLFRHASRMTTRRRARRCPTAPRRRLHRTLVACGDRALPSIMGVQLRAGERGGGDAAPGPLRQGVRRWLRPHEKGGRRHDMPVRHRAARFRSTKSSAS